jgi:hypothetical protein
MPTVDASLVSELQISYRGSESNYFCSPRRGDVLGVWVYNGDVYAFRNKSGGATAGMYKSTSTGWTRLILEQP